MSNLTSSDILEVTAWEKPYWESVLGSSSRQLFEKLTVSIPRPEGPISPDNDNIVMAVISVFASFLVITLAIMIVYALIMKFLLKSLKLEKKFLYAFRLFTYGVLAIAVFMCYFSNQSFKDDLAGSEGALEQVRGTFYETRDYIGSTSDGVDKLDSDITVAVSKTYEILFRIESLRNGPDELLGMVRDFSANYSNLVVTNNGTLFACSDCVEFSNLLQVVENDVQRSVVTAFEDVQEVTSRVRTELANSHDEIHDGLVSGQQELDDISDEFNENEADLNDALDTSIDIEMKRYTVLQIFMAFIIFSLLAMPFCANGCCKWFVVILILLVLTLLAAFHMVLGVALQDTCDYIDKQKEELFEKDSEVAVAAKTCLTNGTLSSAFGFEDDLAYSSIDIDSSIVPSVDELNVSTLRELSATVSNFTMQDTFGFNSSIIDEDLVAFNTDPFYTDLLESSYNRTTIELASTTDSGTGGEAARAALKQKLIVSIETESLLLEKIASMNNDMAAMDAKLDESIADLNALRSEVDRMDVIVEPVQLSAIALIEGSNCGFLGQAAVNILARLCSGVQASTTLLSICLIWFAILILTEMQIAAAVGSAEDYKRNRHRLKHMMSQFIPRYECRPLSTTDKNSSNIVDVSFHDADLEQAHNHRTVSVTAVSMPPQIVQAAEPPSYVSALVEHDEDAPPPFSMDNAASLSNGSSDNGAPKQI